MRRLLVITYHYPPRPSIGSVRPRGLTKYLPKFGWDCVVVTPKLDGTLRSDEHVIESGYIDLVQEWKRRLHLNHTQTVHEQFNLHVASTRNGDLFCTSLVNCLKDLVLFPDPTKGWISFACREIETLLAQHFDAIVSSAPPVTAHAVARRAKALLRIPWIADFRDLWALNVEAGILRPLERLWEKKTLAAADALVTVSDVWAQRLRSAYGSKAVWSITNGFDPEDFPPRSHRLTDRFSITYTGQLYRGRRDPTPLLEAVQELIQQGIVSRERIHLRFYGPVESWLPSLVNNLGLSDITDVAGTISRQEAIERQRESQILLQLGWYDPREKGQHTGKLFEYLGSRRPILALGGAPGVMSDLLMQTATGVHVQSKSELRDYLICAYRQFESKGCVQYEGREHMINQYTHLEMARKFAEVLNTVVGETAMA